LINWPLTKTEGDNLCIALLTSQDGMKDFVVVD